MSVPGPGIKKKKIYISILQKEREKKKIIFVIKIWYTKNLKKLDKNV